MLLHQAGEIWHISASPADKGVLATCYNKSEYLWGSGCPRTTCYKSECPLGSGCPRTACFSESASPGGLIVWRGGRVVPKLCTQGSAASQRSSDTGWMETVISGYYSPEPKKGSWTHSCALSIDPEAGEGRT